ncbi:MAG: hypothetical protein LBH22_01040 [Bacteroidales bacterium]|nr:hypothetical protein [Bacteroidales bacterium]
MLFRPGHTDLVPGITTVSNITGTSATFAARLEIAGDTILNPKELRARGFEIALDEGFVAIVRTYAIENDNKEYPEFSRRAHGPAPDNDESSEFARNTIYFVRAYSRTSAAGTTYGEARQFRTLP